MAWKIRASHTLFPPSSSSTYMFCPTTQFPPREYIHLILPRLIFDSVHFISFHIFFLSCFSSVRARVCPFFKGGEEDVRLALSLIILFLTLPSPYSTFSFPLFCFPPWVARLGAGQGRRERKGVGRGSSVEILPPVPSSNVPFVFHERDIRRTKCFPLPRWRLGRSICLRGRLIFWSFCSLGLFVVVLARVRGGRGRLRTRWCRGRGILQVRRTWSFGGGSGGYGGAFRFVGPRGGVVCR